MKIARRIFRRKTAALFLVVAVCSLGASAAYGILAKATSGAEIAADSIDHLRRYIEMLFSVGTEQAKRLREGDSK